MNNSPLVTIITPCYNMEKYIHRLLDSVLAQTYKNIELIVVDDGSKDSLKDIIYSYMDKFESSGMKLIYIYQENAGQSAAINKGLAAMTGDYLTWIDSDDFFKNTSIEKRLNALIDAGEGHFSISQYELVNENSLDKVIRTGKRVKPTGEDNFFEDLITCKNVVFASGGGFMVRTSDWLKACPDNHIYESTEGQNWQLMLPITYNYKCIYIEEPLYIVVEHSDSHSRIARTLEQSITRNLNFITLHYETISKINIPNKDYFLEISYQSQMNEIIYNCIKHKNKTLLNKYYNEYKLKYPIAARICFIKQKFRYILSKIKKIVKKWIKK